jgi:hypothetical protein
MFGIWHFSWSTGPGTSQQISPGKQQLEPQQVSAPVHTPPLQGGVPHVPWLQ